MISNRYGTKYSFVYFQQEFPLVLNFFSSITGRNIISEEWLFFSQILLSIPLAVSILLCCNALKYDRLKNIISNHYGNFCIPFNCQPSGKS